MNSFTGVELFLFAAAAFYSFVVLSLAVGIGRLRYPLNLEKPFVSVIVAARNEERTIKKLLEHLIRQDYSSLELVIVNDRSTDRTAEIIREFQTSHPAIKVVDITTTSREMPAKKHALEQGIAVSKGQILCFTDADCAPPPRWISSLVSAFDQNVGLVAGYSPYTLGPEGLQWTPFLKIFHNFIEYEEFKGATWAASSIGLKRAWLCTGRSLAYRRVVFSEVGGFEKVKHSISGDDDLFLQLVRSTTRWQIRYVTNPESFVPTDPPRTFRDFIQQRTRHFSAGKFFPAEMKVFFFAFHASNLLVFISFIEALASGRSWHAYVPFITKCAVDSILFFRVARLFRTLDFAPSFLLYEFLYILYNSFIGPIGIVAKFTWKPEDNR